MDKKRRHYVRRPLKPQSPREALARLRQVCRDKLRYLGRDEFGRRLFAHIGSTFTCALGKVGA